MVSCLKAEYCAGFPTNYFSINRLHALSIHTQGSTSIHRAFLHTTKQYFSRMTVPYFLKTKEDCDAHPLSHIVSIITHIISIRSVFHIHIPCTVLLPLISFLKEPLPLICSEETRHRCTEAWEIQRSTLLASQHLGIICLVSSETASFFPETLSNSPSITWPTRGRFLLLCCSFPFVLEGHATMACHSKGGEDGLPLEE